MLGGLVNYSAGGQRAAYHVNHRRMLGLPLCEVTQFPEDKLPGGANATRGKNPLQVVYPLDWAFFNVYDRKTVVCPEGDGEEWRRVKVLDTLPVTFLQYDRWAGDGLQLKCLALPALCAGFERMKSGEESGERFMDTPVATLWRSHTTAAKSGTECASIVQAGAHVFMARRKGECGKWGCVGVAFFSLLAASRDGSGGRLAVTVLGTENVEHSLPDWRGGPLLSVWRSEAAENGDGCQQALRLPLIGPVWSTWTADGDGHWGLFPRLTLWRRFPY